jgi:hypothetical protein
MTFCERGLAADPKNAYLWLSKAYHARSMGDKLGARTATEEACRLKPDDEELKRALFWDRFALREFEPLERETRAAIEKEPLQWDYHARMIQILAARGDIAGARAHQADYAAKLAKQTSPIAATVSLNSACQMMALEGKYTELLAKTEASSAGDGETRFFCFNAHLGLGQPDLAAKVLEDMPGQRGSTSLMMCLAWVDKGDAAKSAEWRSKATEQLARGSRSDKQVAGILAKATAPDMDLVRDVATDANDRMAMLLILADACPAHRTELLAASQKVTCLPPYLNPFFDHVRKSIAARGDK